MAGQAEGRTVLLLGWDLARAASRQMSPIAAGWHPLPEAEFEPARGGQKVAIQGPQPRM